MSIMWRFRGSPHYLDAQAKRLGVAESIASRARHNAEIFRVQVLLAQLSERYHRAPKENGEPRFGGPELAQIKGTLEQAELEVQKLHMLAASAAAAVDEAAAAFHCTLTPRPYELLCEYDTPRLPPRDETVGSTVNGAAGVAPYQQAL